MSGTEQIDFRQEIHRLGLGPGQLDPLDLNAYRLPTGVAITADYREAEIATPPIPVTSGFGLVVEGHAGAARSLLQATIAGGETLSGYSTHINVSVPTGSTESVAEIYARTFAPALILLMDNRTSPGLLVRPRPGRLELGGEFVDGSRLRAALAFAVGSVVACINATGEPRTSLPQVRIRVDAAYERFGWYIDRNAGGTDLLSLGRRATLERPDGSTVSAGEHLTACWRVARASLNCLPVSDDDLVEADAMVAGTSALPSELDDDIEPVTRHRNVDPGPFGRIVHPIHRGGFDLAPVLISWSVCVLVLVNRDRSRRAFVNVPLSSLGAFFLALDAGRLDECFSSYLKASSVERILARVEQVSEPGIYDAIGRRLDLLPTERLPDRTAVESGAGSGSP